MGAEVPGRLYSPRVGQAGNVWVTIGTDRSCGGHGDLVDITIGTTVVTATPNYPFWTVDRGRVNAAELRADDLVVNADGTKVAVTNTTATSLVTTVRTLDVAGQDSFHVGAAGILVHE